MKGMKITNPIVKRALHLGEHESGHDDGHRQRARVRERVVLFGGEHVELVRARLSEHPGLERHFTGFDGLGRVLRAVQIRLQGVVVHLFNTGVITTSEMKRAMPAITWFGGVFCRPRALRVRPRTMKMRVKPVNKMSAEGRSRAPSRPR